MPEPSANPSEFPKTLLVSLTPPGGRNVGEIILSDLCRLLPRDKVAVVAVCQPRGEKLPEQTIVLPPPSPKSWRPLPGKWGGLCNYLWVRLYYSCMVKKLVRKIVAFGREQQVEQVWLVLNTPALIASGSRIADLLGVPMRALVWDPPEWVILKNHWDKLSRQWLKKRFGEALRASKRVMVVSDEMVKEYGKAYGTTCDMVRHALPACSTPAADLPPPPGQPIRIGFAGTLYDNNQLSVLLKALHKRQWTILGRPIVLRMIGNWYRFKDLNFPCHIELLGWRSSKETHTLLEECHINYLPITFQERWQDFARLSFPTKWSTYLATGRPVLVHSPAYSSSVTFFNAHPCGACCTTENPDDLAEALFGLLQDTPQYQQAMTTTQSLCRSTFQYEGMKQSFYRFFEITESGPAE